MHRSTAQAGGQATLGARQTGLRVPVRYATVAAAFTPVWAALVWALAGALDDLRVVCVVAGLLVAVPSFFANKLIVWRTDDPLQVRREAGAYVVVTAAGLALGVATTAGIEGLIDASGSAFRGGLVVIVAQVLGSAAVAVIRFLLLDRWVFDAAAESPTR